MVELDDQPLTAAGLEQPTSSEISRAATMSGMRFFMNKDDFKRF
jgi:hypothetical protein